MEKRKVEKNILSGISDNHLCVQVDCCNEENRKVRITSLETSNCKLEKSTISTSTHDNVSEMFLLKTPYSRIKRYREKKKLKRGLFIENDSSLKKCSNYVNSNHQSPNKFSDIPSVTIDNDSFNANHKNPLTSAHVKEKLIVPETDMLNEDHICTFGELLRTESSSTFNMQSTLYLYTLQYVIPIQSNQKHIQILFSGPYNSGHWICSYYDGIRIYIYDSLNNGCLNEDQKNYLIKLYPFKPPVVFAAVHQQRVGSVDCGVFAIAYATSLYFNTMPNTLDYVYDEMRQHIRLMFTNNHLIPFPAKPTTKIRCLIVESDWERLSIDRATELQPRKVKHSYIPKAHTGNIVNRDLSITYSEIVQKNISSNLENNKSTILDSRNYKSYQNTPAISSGIVSLENASTAYTLKTPYKRIKKYREIKKLEQKSVNKKRDSNIYNSQTNIISTSDNHSSVHVDSNRDNEKLEITCSEKSNCNSEKSTTSTSFEISSHDNVSEMFPLKTPYSRIKRYREKKKLKRGLFIENDSSLKKCSNYVNSNHQSPNKFSDTPSVTIDNDSFNANHKSPLTSAHVKEKLIVPETDMLNEDHICTFGELLRRESSSTFNMQSTLYLYTLQYVIPIQSNQKHIQILFSGLYNSGHWICSYYDGIRIYIYDSLNNGCLNEDQKNYLIKLYPFKPPVVFAAVHQQRVGSVDCGVFAIAYATSLYFNTMPNTLDYVYDEMRQHIRLMFTNNHLIPFPAKPTTKIRCLIVESDWDRLLIDRAAELQPRINNTNEQHFSATSDIDYAHDVLTTFQFKINDERQVINREKEHLKRKSLVTNANCLNKKIYYDHSLNVNKESERDLMLDSNNCNPQHQLSFTSDKLSSIDINTVHLQESQKNNMTHKAVCSEHYLGKMNHLCQHCEAKHFKDEQIQGKKNSYNDCCSHGGVNLQSKDYPHELRILLDGSHPKSVHFIKHIRCYNSSFAFASFHANIVDFNSRRRGPYCFKIQGQIYYQINNALYPETGVDPNFGQLFIYDADDAVQYRLNYNDNLDSEILYSIESVMRTHNAFTKSFKMMKEVIDIETELARASNQKVPELKLLFTLKKGMDRRRYNFQRVDEVAAIFNTNSEGEVPESYVTVHNKATKELQLVSSLDPNVEPWIYPIYYPYGVEGYNINMIRSDSHQRRKKVRISRAAFIKYKIAIRDKEFNPFLHGGRLFQQWLVDNAVKNEKDKLSFCANNQSQLRCESYKGLIDHMQNVSNENEMHIGKMVILPSTFIGSPRNMMQQYQDAMAIVRNHGKPDLFITMTCNPQWTEIQENLLPNQTASDRPDIVARVFSSKVNHLIEIIVRQRLFGDVKSFVYVIEFQKRGLPHIHMLVILKENSKILSPESVDHFISAEIPDENINSTLHKIIMQNNIHGPCGDWCLVDGKCSKHFPKDFQDDTIMGDNSYVLYRRRDTGKTYERPNGYIVDNRHVVPYCPVLSQIFNCHINVEIVSSIKSVKYLYKYIYKGHDAASIIITNVDGQNSIDYNEIRHYEENRYVGPVEAVWRILSKPLAKKSHSVNRLPIHLPNEQNVIIREGQENREISFLLEKKTKLLDYFDLNKRDSNAHRYYYSEIPEHYTWISDSLEWRPRKRFDNIIGRIYSVSPSQIELFHLRLLLLTTKGATSFKDLKSVDGVIHETFTSACLALGLIEDDHEWVRTIEEAAVWMMPQLLRRLFVRILIHCNPVEPNELWERFKGIMSEDYRGIESVEAENKAYRDIKTLLSNEGYRLTDFQGLLDIEDEQNISEKNNDYNVQRHIILGNEKYMQLNVKQKIVVDYVLKSVHDSVTSNCRCIYVDGPGGSGKTFLYNTLWHLLRSRGKNVCNMAFTGIAATLLPNGKTVHKILGLPVPLYSDSSSSIKVQSKEGTFLKGTDVFIWDEAPMAPKYALEIMDRLLRDVMKSNEPFGGKVLILGGDFRQTLPIKERGTRSEIVNLSIKNSKVWKHFKKFNLSENMRVLPEETAFTDFLLKVGNGELNDINDNIELPEKIIQEGNVDIVDDVYGDLIRENRYQEIAKCAILAPRNVDVDEINKRVVQLLKSDKEKIYKSIDSTENCDNGDFNDVILPEYLNGLSPPVLPPHELHLRIHSVVMLIRNLSINEGLCNGTRLLILDLLNNVIKCQILTGDKCGNIVFLHRITLYCENVYPFVFKRRQFPIKLAFAMTINKSQGQTFNKIAIDLRRDVFNHGQLYVALSRVRSFDSVKIYLGDHRSNKLIKNYVYTEVLEQTGDIENKSIFESS